MPPNFKDFRKVLAGEKLSVLCKNLAVSEWLLFLSVYVEKEHCLLQKKNP